MGRLNWIMRRVALASRQCWPEHGQDARATRPRRGVVIVIVMVCFILAAAIFVSLARTAAVERQTVRSRHWNLQARWLAEAAMERAVARLDEDADYAGETWTIVSTELAGRDGAVVRIHIEPVADHVDRRRVQVEADFPDDPRHRCRCKKMIVVERKETTSPKDAEKPKTPKEPE